MLHYNIERVILMRGHANPTSYLKRMGYTRWVINHLLSKPRHLNISYLERLCHELRCTPNDLMEWTSAKSEPIEEDHPLAKLIRTDGTQTMREAILRLPPEKLSEAIAYMNELSAKE